MPRAATPAAPVGEAAAVLRPPRRRDAAKTRQQLLDAARHLFAQHGYAATTVRDIAEEAGVNVALINRYFASKEGLFAASLTAADDDLRRTVGDVSLADLPHAIAREVADLTTPSRPGQLLALLLRSSGDERADQIRLGVLRGYAERLASVTGPRPHDDDGSLLRAEILLAATTGLALLRTSGLQPLASATVEDLLQPLQELVDALLSRS